jgi:tRNA (mo5U34)-methyltransferase
VRIPDAETARRFAARTDFIWHQRWELAPGVFTPGVSDIPWLLDLAGVPRDLTGQTVLDIGTTNGAAAFEAERRGAQRVVAVDILDPEWFGFAQTAELLESEVAFVQASTYELTSALGGETFDLVLFLGVLYHLRHPLLALDNVRAATRGTCILETAVCDHELAPDLRDRTLAAYYRTDELGGDASNWFAPTVKAFAAWTGSSGFATEVVDAWPAEAPGRAMLRATALPGDPEWMTVSYERPLNATVAS